MVRSDDLEKGGTSPKRPGSMENGVKSEGAEKKPRLSKMHSKSSRKRAWNEAAETDMNLKESEDLSTSRKVSRIGSTKKNDGEGDKLVEHRGTGKFKDSEPNMQESGSKLGEMSYVQKPQPSQRKWKRTPKSGLEHDEGSSARSSRGAADSSFERMNPTEKESGEQKRREREVVRKVLQTVHLEESSIVGEKETIADDEKESIGLEEESEDIVSSLKQTALNSSDRKRRGADKADVSPSTQPEKKLRVDVLVADASSRGEEQGIGASFKNAGTWKRLKGQNTKSSAAASEDMGVSVSEAWKRLREEKEKDTATSGSSVNGRSDSDLSMHSSDSELEMLEERSKKARHDLPLPPQGRKWTRKNREKKESSSSKRLREGNGCESSGSSGSDISHSSYYHNRKWKRPRFEYMMSVQGRSWRKQARDGEEARMSLRENSRKRVQCDTSEKPTKRQRK